MASKRGDKCRLFCSYNALPFPNAGAKKERILRIRNSIRGEMDHISVFCMYYKSGVPTQIEEKRRSAVTVGGYESAQLRRSSMMYSGRFLISSKRTPMYCPSTPIVSSCTPPKKMMAVMIELHPVSA